MRERGGAQAGGSSPGGALSGRSGTSVWRARACSLRRRRFSRNACARRASLAARAARRPGVRRGASSIAAMEREPRLACQSPLDAQADLGRENHRNRLPRRILGGLVRMCAPPRLDAGAIAVNRRQTGVVRHIEGFEHRRCGDIVCRIDCRTAPNHAAKTAALPHRFRWSARRRATASQGMAERRSPCQAASPRVSPANTSATLP